MDSSSSSHPVNCPCKYVPLHASSHTLATYGLLSHGHSSRVRLLPSPVGSFVHLSPDSSGLTCLHYSSQHNHVSDVRLLLDMLLRANASLPDPALSFVSAVSFASPSLARGCTPLHRACYSGSLSSLSLLLSSFSSCLLSAVPSSRLTVQAAIQTALMARDYSTGDGKTCVAKAASAGRPAVLSAVLNFAATEFGREFVGELLQLPKGVCLVPTDEVGPPAAVSPLVALASSDGASSYSSSPYSRWDEVAGGPPDWSLVVKVILSYTSYASTPDHPLPPFYELSSSSDPLPPPQHPAYDLSPLPAACPPGCEECPADVLSSWTAAFNKALDRTPAVNPPAPQQPTLLSFPPDDPPTDPPSNLPAAAAAKPNEPPASEPPKAKGAQCARCGDVVFILKLFFDNESGGHVRLCRSCFDKAASEV